jgi:HAD superfamily hydrolase (TIGR01509 family)
VPLRAVVFDFDGVIADSEPLHFRAFRDTLAEIGLPLSEHEYYDRLLGFDDLGVFEAVGRDRGLGWDAGRVGRLAAVKARRLEAIEGEASLLFPGVEALVRRLGDAVPLAIASGARREEIVRVLDRTRLVRWFPVIVAAGETVESKPAPDPYRRAVELLAESAGRQLDPADCVAIEDSHWGLESARAAGLRTVGVTHSYAAESLGVADLIVPDLGSLQLADFARLCAAR